MIEMHLPPHLAHHGLYDGDGRHLGSVFQSVMINNQLTPAHAAVVAGRPFKRLFWDYRICSDPASNLGLVWFLPVEPNPLATALDVVPYLVQALDAGQAVQFHAAGVEEIDTLCTALTGLVGGGHA